jgi:hypothetical protein
MCSPKHSGLIDALNRIPEQDFSHIKRVGKACALSGGLLGFLFWNMVPQWMEYILLAFAALAWIIIVSESTVAAPLWAIQHIAAVGAQYDFEMVSTQLKILDPSLSEVLTQIEHRIENNICDAYWLSKVVTELNNHQVFLEQTLTCSVENNLDQEQIKRALCKNLQL